MLMPPPGPLNLAGVGAAAGASGEDAAEWLERDAVQSVLDRAMPPAARERPSPRTSLFLRERLARAVGPSAAHLIELPKPVLL